MCRFVWLLHTLYTLCAHFNSELNWNMAFFFSFSGLIGLALCAVACASILHKTSTTSEATSRAAMGTCSHSVRCRPVRGACSSATPRLSRSTCCTSIPNSPLVYSLQGKCLYPPIAEMRGTSVEDVDFRTPQSLQWRSTSFSSTWTVWQNSILVTDYTFKEPHL